MYFWLMTTIISKELLDEMKLGDILYSARMEQNLLQDEVAIAVNKKQSHISQIEGYKHLPSLKVLVEYLDAIGHELIIQPK